jgi:hypothetical protein
LVASLGFTRLPDYFSEAVLRDTRAVTVGRIPFPPIASYGLPEFASLEQMGMAGITFENLCFVHESLNSESVHFHEVVHAIQWATLGVDHFLLSYGTGLLQLGYAHNPFEAVAFDLQSQFDRGMPIPDAAGMISAHARKTRDSTADLFRQHGLPLGA